MSARIDILSAISAAAVPASPAASPLTTPHASHDLSETFIRVLASVGGSGIVRRPDQSREQVVAAITAQLDPLTVNDLVIVTAHFGVAENGAVYVDAADLHARVDMVRATHLILIVPRDALVPTMHEAVRLIPAGSSCGWFLSGPSKTADIEQSLVIGAQGSRTLHVILEPRE